MCKAWFLLSFRTLLKYVLPCPCYPVFVSYFSWLLTHITWFMLWPRFLWNFRCSVFKFKCLEIKVKAKFFSIFVWQWFFSWIKRNGWQDSKGCAKTQICNLFSRHLNYCHRIQNSLGYWCRQKFPSSSAETCLGLSWSHHRIWWHGLLLQELQEYTGLFKYWTTMRHKAALSAYLCNNIKVQGMVSIQPGVLEAPQEVKDVLWYLRRVTPSEVLQVQSKEVSKW